jgi:AraC-like DNA-binding protein
MDPFADVLRAMRLTGGIFLDARFTAPWCVSSRIGPEDCGRYVPVPRSIIAFHFVSSGRLWVETDGQSPLTAERGDIVVLPGNDAHRLGSDLNLEPVDAGDLIQPGVDGRLARIDFGGGGESPGVVCGFLGTDRQHDPVLAMLPRILKLKAAEDASQTWLESSFQFAAHETVAGLAQSPHILTKLAEVLFMDAVRRYLSALPAEDSRWCVGVRDAKIATALGLLHARMRHRWTTEALAREIGMSRSALAERFTRVMGESPMRYLARQRIQAAAQRLRETNEPVARISFATGYESEAAFSRAFKREFGAPPAAWRQARERS